jgi:hypothetical protein
MSKDLRCPYCDHAQDVNHDDGMGYDECFNEMQCSACDRYFTFNTYVLYSYESEKADCLNRGFHNYKLTKTHPKPLSKMQCSMCGRERELTVEERNLYGICTMDEYLDSLK